MNENGKMDPSVDCILTKKYNLQLCLYFSLSTFYEHFLMLRQNLFQNKGTNRMEEQIQFM